MDKAFEENEKVEENEKMEEAEEEEEEEDMDVDRDDEDYKATDDDDLVRLPASLPAPENGGG